MKRIIFTKMEGTGNDYVYIDLFDQSVSDPAKLAREISHRKFGIGADGMVLIGPSEIADGKMIMYNADGSRAEMCGNAIRCVGKYLWDHQRVKSAGLKIETDAGVKRLELKFSSKNRVSGVVVDMGAPVLKPNMIPCRIGGESFIDKELDFEGLRLRGTLVSMGNPHFVVFDETIEKVPLEIWGPMVENSSLFPNRINLEFVQLIDRNRVTQRTWERGSGETWSCGTGACAVGVAGA
ncbi:MAG: diaminopimelate epimerase, partial [Deltaproteobacteria bacterium]|nr:diaminopimelate epimerase [Deltaproteobacteria bacterium]